MLQNRHLLLPTLLYSYTVHVWFGSFYLGVSYSLLFLLPLLFTSTSFSTLPFSFSTPPFTLSSFSFPSFSPLFTLHLTLFLLLPLLFPFALARSLRFLQHYLFIYLHFYLLTKYKNLFMAQNSKKKRKDKKDERYIFQTRKLI